MGWISVLNETYNTCRDVVGKEIDGQVLLPISHSTANAQAEIVIDTEGNFVRAQTVAKEGAVTIIPVTEDSASRGNGNFPHPLCDKLCYIAGDYDEHIQAGKPKKEYYDAYINQLEQWAASEGAPEKVRAIYTYLKKQSVISDLAREGVIELNENGKMTSAKVEGISQEDLFVRFKVLKYHADNYVTEVWRDQDLYQNFEAYYKPAKEMVDFCYVTGKQMPVAQKHPSRIRNAGDKSKLISSNDTQGYTYRGRFIEPEEVVSIGYETSQKAHNALRWLIQKQGARNDSAYIVAWAVNGSEIPHVWGDTEEAFAGKEEEEESFKVKTSGSSENPIVYTAQGYAEQLNKAIAGYAANLETKDTIVVLSVDTADGSGQGRLAITFYSELERSAFLQNIKSWHLHCAWRHQYKKDEEGYYMFIGAPSPREMALAAYGAEQGGMLKADDKIVKKCVERLLPCIIHGKPFPKDVMLAAVRNAGNPLRMSGYNWSKVLSNTCSMIRKYHYDKAGGTGKKEEWTMELDYDCNDRSYLFGRLLAIADKAEFSTYEINEKRTTNAKRYWDRFSRKPASTWGMIYDKLIPYLEKMSPGSKIWYSNMIANVQSGIPCEEYNNNALSELYLHGYQCQLHELNKKKEKNEDAKESEENNND